MTANPLMAGAWIGVAAVTAAAGWTLFNQWRLARMAAGAAREENEWLAERLRLARLQCRFEQERAEGAWGGFRKFRVVEIREEGGGIKSFHLSPHDGKPLPPFFPGQYLTFSIQLPGQPRPAIRCYSLSEMPATRDRYRVTIKRVKDGAVSGFFHDQLAVGGIVDVKAPSGNFCLDLTRRSPVALIAGGVGITPLMTMLQAQLATGVSREVWFFYCVKNGSEHIWRGELEALASRHPSLHLVVCYSQPSEEDKSASPPAHHHEGRLDAAALEKLLPTRDCDFYLCGPPPMMAALTEVFKGWQLPPERIHFEAFGAATVQKAGTAPDASTTVGLKVRFDRSGKSHAWIADCGSLLELAERHGIAMDSGCRAGNCGTCLVALKSGEVTYLREPGVTVESGSCLACIAVPKTAVSIDA